MGFEHRRATIIVARLYCSQAQLGEETSCIALLNNGHTTYPICDRVLFHGGRVTARCYNTRDRRLSRLVTKLYSCIDHRGYCVKRRQDNSYSSNELDWCMYSSIPAVHGQSRRQYTSELRHSAFNYRYGLEKEACILLQFGRCRALADNMFHNIVKCCPLGVFL